ncbi:MAG: IMPACT family protein [Salibacteraceae bacterium]
MDKDFDSYKEPSLGSESLFKDKGSKHFGYVFPVKTENDIEKRLNEIRKKHFSSRHVCYAWSLGTRKIKTKYTDDGEPHNSAGPPILGQIQSFELKNVLVVVVRYFGGTKLGVGGLINAYKTAAKEAILNNKINTLFLTKTLMLSFPYSIMSDVMRFAKREGITIVSQDFRETCNLKIRVREKFYSDYTEFLSKLHLLETKKLDL